MNKYEFKPDWISPPSDTIKEILEEKKVSVEKFAEMMGMTQEETQAFLNDQVPYSEEVATKLAEKLGSTAQFWINRDKGFEKRLREEYRNWEGCKKTNAMLRRQLESYQRESRRRYRDQQDYLPYEDDPYDR